MKFFNLNFFKILAASLLLSFLSTQSEGFCGRKLINWPLFDKVNNDYNEITGRNLKITTKRFNSNQDYGFVDYLKQFDYNELLLIFPMIDAFYSKQSITNQQILTIFRKLDVLYTDPSGLALSISINCAYKEALYLLSSKYDFHKLVSFRKFLDGRGLHRNPGEPFYQNVQRLDRFNKKMSRLYEDFLCIKHNIKKNKRNY